uniref:Spindle and kinetochore-associated protein 3 n=1 Tax=Denticeps clupeoides TaxID=299321 RepID=A0AAY4DRV0_9TELE
MDSTARFFAKLRSIAIHLETETADLLQIHQNADDDHPEAATRVLHELNSEVRCLKRHVQSQLRKHDEEISEVRNFVHICSVLKQRSTEDMARLTRHYEKYGYKPRQKNTKFLEEIQAGPGEEAVARGDQEKSTPVKEDPPPVDPMRTPQLSDFGLSEMHLKKVLEGLGMHQEPAPLQELSLHPRKEEYWKEEHLTDFITSNPPMPKTPKCDLRLDEDLPTPRLEDFGITEHTTCLNNDFTMDLFRKKPPKTSRMLFDQPEHLIQKPIYVLPEPPTIPPDGGSNESMDSPEPPVFCTPGLKIIKPAAPSLPVMADFSIVECNRAATPELPAFESPLIHGLLSVRKNAAPSSKSSAFYENWGFGRFWSPDVPKMQVRLPQIEQTTPEMSCSLLWPEIYSEHVLSEPSYPNQENHTQEWNLATPRVRKHFVDEPQTPEMPDLSCITQDILKATAPVLVEMGPKAGLHTTAAGKENRRAQSMMPVSEDEFQGLPGYLKQIPLTSLNQAIQKINHALQGRQKGMHNVSQFQMEELWNISGAGLKAPMLLLSLTELKKIEHMQGTGSKATYKILTHSL